MTTYEEYRRLRVECGYDSEHGYFTEQVWNGCNAAAQEDMLQQYRIAADERNAELSKYCGDHW